MDRDQSKTPSVRFADTVSRGRNRASVRKCPEQWGIPKFASGQSHTVALPRMHLLTPYTGEATIKGSFPKITSASKTTLLRSRTQFVPYGYLLFLE